MQLCYASARASSGRVSVYCRKVRQSSWLLAWKLLLTYSTLCYKDIQVSTKIGVPFSGTFPKLCTLQNFAMAYRSFKRVINLARYKWTLRA